MPLRTRTAKADAVVVRAKNGEQVYDTELEVMAKRVARKRHSTDDEKAEVARGILSDAREMSSYILRKARSS